MESQGLNFRSPEQQATQARDMSGQHQDRTTEQEMGRERMVIRKGKAPSDISQGQRKAE